MKWTRLAVPVAALALIAWSAPTALAQASKKANGTVTAVTGDSLTVKDAAGKDMTFAVDKTTQVNTPGGGTKMRAAEAKGETGVKIDEVLKVGEVVEVTYHDMGGTLHAASIRTMAKMPAPAGPPAKTVHGVVKDISGTSLTITDTANKDLTFTIDEKTRAVGKGLGTATKETGGKAPLSDLIKPGAKVSVTYHEEGGTMTASNVLVVTPAPKK
jgi:hypothetical protein